MVAVPITGLTPLQQGVVDFMRLNEQRLREKTIEKMTLYLSNVHLDKVIEKFRKGCEVHGEITLEDWETAFEEECQDAFCYTALADHD